MSECVGESIIEVVVGRHGDKVESQRRQVDGKDEEADVRERGWVIGKRIGRAVVWVQAETFEMWLPAVEGTCVADNTPTLAATTIF